jgi:uncharacterized protein (TIGR02246 family)
MSSNETTGTGTGTDTAAVREVLERAYAAWGDNDADAFAALYLEDATVVMPGVFHQGSATVRGYMAGAFAGPLKGSRAIDNPEDIRILGSDAAVVVSRSGIVMAGEESFPAEREVLATWVLAKQGDQWKIAAYANAPAVRS